MIDRKQLLEFVKENGVSARGKGEYIKFLEGKTLTLRQAVLAHCYDCTNMEAGRNDCEIEDCSLHAFHPYNPNKVKSRTISDEAKARATERLKTMRGKRK